MSDASLPHEQCFFCGKVFSIAFDEIVAVEVETKTLWICRGCAAELTAEICNCCECTIRREAEKMEDDFDEAMSKED
jgi:predicted amidophosphoribosyltransferase